MKYFILVAILFGLQVPPVAAQVFDPDQCWKCRDTYYHAAAGASINLAVRSGLIAESWRHNAFRRTLLVVLVGAAYEGVETFSAWENGSLGESGYGFGLKDLAADIAGALVIEVGAFVIRKVF